MKKRKLFRLKSIRSRITLYFSVLVTIIIISIIASISLLFFNRFSAQKSNLIFGNLFVIVNSIEGRINSLRALSLTIRNDYLLKASLQSKNYQGAKDRMNNLSGHIYGVQSIFLVTEQGVVCDPTYVQPQYGKRLLDITNYDAHVRSNKEESFSATHSFPSDYTTLSEKPPLGNRLTYFHTLRNRPSYQSYACVLMNIDAQAPFLDKIESIQTLFNQFYVLDKKNNLIFSANAPDQAVLKNARQINDKSGTANTYRQIGTNVYFSSAVPSYPGWRVVGVTSNAAFISDVQYVIDIIMLLGILAILMVVIFAGILSKRVTQPIFEIKNAMVEFEQGVIPQKLIAQTQDELGYLIHGFNSMLDDIRVYIDTIYTEQEQKKNAEVQAVQYQLESLQSQINPHFLYNTLNTVSYLALTDQSDKIRELIQALNLLLRATLSDNDTTVRIQTELTFLNSYVSIQKYRYPEMIDFVQQVDPAALHFTIPKLILQPLVENALLHGIFPKGEPGRISLKIYLQDERLHFCIEDDGVGMDTDTLTGICTTKGFNKVGLRNVNDRLVLNYFAESALQFSSVPGVGTTVHFSIPLIAQKGGAGVQTIEEPQNDKV